MADLREPIQYNDPVRTTEHPTNVFAILDELGLTIQRIDELMREKQRLIEQYQKTMSLSESTYSSMVNRPEQDEEAVMYASPSSIPERYRS